MTTIYRDEIAGLSATWHSGLATLYLKHNGHVHGDNGWLCRSLIDLFDASAPGHSINVQAIQDQDIVYVLDEFGLTLAGITTYADYLDQGHPEIKPGGKIEL